VKRDYKTIPRDFREPQSRREAIELINSADREILLIAGELSAYQYPDLRSAAESAVERGVSFKVYACSPDQDTVNRLLYNGFEVYLLSEKPSNHNMIVDGVSYMKTVTKGKTYLKKYINDPAGARKLKKKFAMYMKKPREAKIEGEDPLIIALQSPIDSGVKTDSSKIHEYFG